MTIIKRADLGRPLTWDELDDNFQQVDDLTAAASAAVSSASASATAAASSATASATSATDAANSAADAATAIVSAVKSTITFTTGGTLNSNLDRISDGTYLYYWTGSYPVTVPANSTLEDTGGIAVGFWAPDTELIVRQQLADALDLDAYPAKWERASLSHNSDNVASKLNSIELDPYEFEDLIVTKGSDDPQTWDWAPALQAAIDKAVSYVSQTAVNSAMYGSIKLRLPAGIYPTYSALTVTRYGSSAGSLATSLTIVGDGTTSSIIQPMVDGQTALIAYNCKINLVEVGFRAGSTNQIGIQLGLKDTWVPVFHCHTSRLGLSGFALPFRNYLCFDSTHIDPFIQNIAPLNSSADTSVGLSISEYTGPATAGGTAGDGSGDDSNHIVFIRPTIETSNSDNAIMWMIDGLNSDFPHHAISCFGGHIETHNLTTKTLHIDNAYNLNFVGTVFSQNGSSVSTMYRHTYIADSRNVNFIGCRFVTTNRLSTYSSSDTKMISVTGTSYNIGFIRCHFLGPYNNISAEAHNLAYLIDTSGAAIGERAIDTEGSTCGNYTSRPISNIKRVSSLDGKKEAVWQMSSAGDLTMYYSTTIADSATGNGYWGVMAAGTVVTYGDLTLGALNGTAATRSIGANTGSVRFDPTGRVYLNAISSTQQWVMGSTAFNPSTDASFSLGQPTLRPSAVYSVKYMNSATVGVNFGTGSPEGVLTAGIGSLYLRTDGSASTTLYVKESGTGNTGWVAK